MTCLNPDNERVKRRYFHHMREAKGLADATIDHAGRAIAQFERHTDWASFDRFGERQATSFKRGLLNGGGKRSAELSSRATVYSKLNHLETFFKWLAEQPGYKSKVRICDAEYFHLPRRDAKLARERPEKPAPTLEQVQAAIRQMPSSTDVELRDRAVMAFLILTGARVRAVTTFKLKHLRSDRLGIKQDARDVATKGSKTFTTFYFRVGDDIRDIFLAYADRLRTSLGYGSSDPLFPRTKQTVAPGKNVFEIVGLEKAHWKTPDPVRTICRRAFEGAGIVYFSPHTFRRTLAQLAEQRCRTAAELKAWSQNLGHDDLMTTLTSYGALPEAVQAKLVAGMEAQSQVPNSPAMWELARLLVEEIRAVDRSGPGSLADGGGV